MRVADSLRAGFDAAADWFLPRVCLCCQVPFAPREGHSFLCRPCLGELRRVVPAECARCNPWSGAVATCPTCSRLPAALASRRAAFPYAGVAGDLVRFLKYRHRPHVADALANVTLAVLGEHLDRLRDEGATALVPVPMHWTRRMRRGGNHAEAFARALAPLVRVPCDPDLLLRARRTAPQARRHTVRSRLSNVRDSFGVLDRDAVQGQTVILIDDVTTTGATFTMAGRALLDAGARAVHAVAICQAATRLSQTVPFDHDAAGARWEFR